MRMVQFCAFCGLGIDAFNPQCLGLLHWEWTNQIIAPVPVEQPWRMLVDESH